LWGRPQVCGRPLAGPRPEADGASACRPGVCPTVRSGLRPHAAAIANLAKELLEIEATGDRARADAWFAKHDRVPPELESALAKVTDVPWISTQCSRSRTKRANRRHPREAFLDARRLELQRHRLQLLIRNYAAPAGIALAADGQRRIEEDGLHLAPYSSPMRM